ncbi:MAG: RluA family pseudouridine synthase [Planctomycetota bacterium]
MRRRRKAPREVRQAPRDLSRAVDELSWTVELDDHEQRLDLFLSARLEWRSRTSIVELLQAGQVRVGEEVVRKKAWRVRQGDRVAVAVPPPEEPERHAELAEELEPAVLYEDEHLIALAKPAGLVVHPVGRIRVNTLIQALHWRFRHGARQGEEVLGGSRPGEVGPVVPRVCHRLDRDTSGVIVLAKNAAARTALGLVIEGDRRALGELTKEYVACVHGAPDPPTGEVDAAIGPDEASENEVLVTLRPDGLPARTSYAVEAVHGARSWVRFTLHTGRQHQIRIHAAQGLGCPILCDPLYGRGERGFPEGVPVIARQALHAERLVLPHPASGAPLGLRAPWPADLRALFERAD